MEYLKSIYEFTINDFTIFEQTSDISILRKNKRIVFTKKQNKKLQSEIEEVIKSISDLFGGSNEDLEIDKDNKLIYYYQKTIQLQEVLSKLLLYMHFDLTVKKDKNGLKLLEITFNDEYKEIFKDEIGRDFEGIEKDKKDFSNKLEFYTNRYLSENEKRDAKPNEKGAKVSDLIPKLERVLGYSINRELKMFTMKGYYEEVLKISKDNG